MHETSDESCQLARFLRSQGHQPFSKTIIALLILRPQGLCRLTFTVRIWPSDRAELSPRAQESAATCHSGPSSCLGPRPYFYGVRTGPPGATVSVLVSGVPRSTCWKAQLWPIYIGTTRS